jgi:putative DNA primase/helicase
VHLRTAQTEQGKVIWLDLADKSGRAVRIDATGWGIVRAPAVPVKFSRTPNMRPLPEPLREEADASHLRLLINLPSESEFRLLLTAMSFALIPEMPYPILNFDGLAGAAKTSAARAVRNTIDPSEVPVAGMPKGQDLVAYAKNNWMPVFDNLSILPAAFQDDLCRLATGGGMGGRKFFTNDGEATFNASRPMILTGINNLATRGDLADRSLPFHLAAIPETSRLTDQEIKEGFEYAHPRVLAALLDIVVTGLRRMESVKRQKRPLGRMADFTLWGFAVAPAVGWSEDDFRLAYRATRKEAFEAVIENDPVAAGILALMYGEREGGTWQGSATELWHTLVEAAGEPKPRGFPQSPEALGLSVKRVTSALAWRGIRIVKGRARAGVQYTIEAAG